MALTLSNSGITSGSVVRAAEISQSIDAFTGAEAYDITLSGSFTTVGPQEITGSLNLSGSVESTGSLNVSGSGLFSGSLIANGGFTGSLKGDADKIKTSVAPAAQFSVLMGLNTPGDTSDILIAPNSQFVYNVQSEELKTTASVALDAVSSSYTLSGSYALTASYAENAAGGGGVPSGNGTEIQFRGGPSSFDSEASFYYNTSTAAAIATAFSASAISASTQAGTMRIDGNNIFSNRPNRMYIGNESTSSNAAIMFVVGGTGTAANSALNISSNQELMFGNPATAYSYPLGFAAGELGSYAQFTNDNAVSSSLVSIMGNNSDSDGLLFVGSDNSNGGGLSYKGDTNSPFGNLSFLNSGSIELYRQSGSTAYPLISAPITDKPNKIDVVVGTTRNTISNTEYFGLTPYPDNRGARYRRTYPIVPSQIPTAASTQNLNLPADVEGVYVVTVKFSTFQFAPSLMGSGLAYGFTEVFYVNAAGSPPIQAGSTKVIYNESWGGISGVGVTLNPTNNQIDLTINNQSGVTLLYNGFVDVDFQPII